MQILLLSCSRKKASYEKPVKAVDLYTGVFFSVYKKALRTAPGLSTNIKLLIISAKYGLIEDTDIITYYDQKMTAETAIQQRCKNTEKLKEIIESVKPKSMVVVMGKQYLQSVNLSDISIPCQVINGEIGMMLHDLKEWLESEFRKCSNVH